MCIRDRQKIRLKNFHYAMSLSKERLRIAEASHLVGKFSGLDYQQAKVGFNADSAQYISEKRNDMDDFYPASHSIFANVNDILKRGKYTKYINSEGNYNPLYRAEHYGREVTRDLSLIHI